MLAIGVAIEAAERPKAGDDSAVQAFVFVERKQFAANALHSSDFLQVLLVGLNLGILHFLFSITF